MPPGAVDLDCAVQLLEKPQGVAYARPGSEEPHDDPPREPGTQSEQQHDGSDRAEPDGAPLEQGRRVDVRDRQDDPLDRPGRSEVPGAKSRDGKKQQVHRHAGEIHRDPSTEAGSVTDQPIQLGRTSTRSGRGQIRQGGCRRRRLNAIPVADPGSDRTRQDPQAKSAPEPVHGSEPERRQNPDRPELAKPFEAAPQVVGDEKQGHESDETGERERRDSEPDRSRGKPQACCGGFAHSESCSPV